MPKQKYLKLRVRGHRINLLLDKVLFFKYLQKVRGRFWGIAGLIGLSVGIALCFIIEPNLRSLSTAFSDFGNDIRTAPYFAGALFFASYGLWRWRNYIDRSVKHSRLLSLLLTLTILSLYMIALMPAGWYTWPHRIHIIGVFLLGITICSTVILDTLLLRTKPGKNMTTWRLLRFTSFCLIVCGGLITLASLDQISYLNLSGLGELFMLIGYGLWIVEKTYRGDGGRTTLSKFLRDFVTIN